VEEEGLEVWGVRSGGRGRKLQDPGGRLLTRVKISEMRRCWTDVSCIVLLSVRILGREEESLDLPAEYRTS
jgi:hypothetical protein